MDRHISYLFAISFSLGIIACNSTSKSKTEAESDPCISIGTALTGVYKSPDIDGTMTWSGGIKGSVEMSGKDYNDMECTYSVNDCGNGIIKMFCEGAPHNSTIELLPNNQIKLGQTTYDKIQ